jgi:hydroxymethylbilane synthase
MLLVLSGASLNDTATTQASATRTYRVGTRGSALALTQTNMVIGRLGNAHPGQLFEQTIVRTEGDADQTSPLSQIGGRGVFTSALQQRLLSGDIDLAVHSAKDVPSVSPDGLTLAAFPEREDPRDVLISRHGVSIAELPRNPVIGTSSRRRAVQVLALRPDAVVRELRGNIDTRLRKAQTAAYDAIILAAAGVARMGWADSITQSLELDQFTPSPAQGAIAVETRDDGVAQVVAAIDDARIHLAVNVERAFLRGVGGGCTTPIGACAQVEGDSVILRAMLSDDDGKRLVRETVTFPVGEAEASAFALARDVQRRVFSTGAQTASLQGKTVLLTGSESQANSLRERLEQFQGAILQLETFRIEPPESAPEEALDGSFDWAVVTSPNAFPYAVPALSKLTRDGARLAVVGRRTGETARKHGFTPEIAGSTDASELAALLIEHGVRGSRIACLVSDIAMPTLPEALAKAGAEVNVITAYRNVPVTGLSEHVESIIRSGHIDVVTFASPSAVRGFVASAGAYLSDMSSASFVAIGQTTASAMRDAGIPVHDVASTPDAEGVIEAIVRTTGRTVETIT